MTEPPADIAPKCVCGCKDEGAPGVRAACGEPALYLFTWAGFEEHALRLCARCVAYRREHKAHLSYRFSIRSLP